MSISLLRKLRRTVENLYQLSNHYPDSEQFKDW